jgi:hypothetical protein
MALKQFVYSSSSHGSQEHKKTPTLLGLRHDTCFIYSSPPLGSHDLQGMRMLLSMRICTCMLIGYVTNDKYVRLSSHSTLSGHHSPAINAFDSCRMRVRKLDQSGTSRSLPSLASCWTV